MRIFGSNKLSLEDTENFGRLIQYSSEKRAKGEPCLGPEGIQMILRNLSKARSDPFAPDFLYYRKNNWVLENTGAALGLDLMLKRIVTGSIELCLKDILWYAGTAQQDRFQIAIEDDPRGASVYWGTKFFYFVKKLDGKRYATYTL